MRLVHEGKLSPNDGWEAICQYNAAMLRPAWPVERLKQEADRIWALHVKKSGPALLRNEAGHIMLVKRHGARFVTRLLDGSAHGRLDRDFLVVGNDEAMLGEVTLDLGAQAALWASHLQNGRG